MLITLILGIVFTCLALYANRQRIKTHARRERVRTALKTWIARAERQTRTEAYGR